MKNLLIASIAAVGLLASSTAFADTTTAPKMTKSGKVSKAHHCVKDGAEVKSAKGKTIRRGKTCAKNGGTWELVNAAAAK